MADGAPGDDEAELRERPTAPRPDGVGLRAGGTGWARGDRRGALVAGRYRPLVLLSEGGQAWVFRAFDESLHRVVAIKVYKASLAEIDDAAFEEARRLNRIEHRCLVRVHDAGPCEWEGVSRAYLVMDEVEGAETIDNYCVSARPTLGAVCRMFADIAEALGVLHARGIVHRDIKPGNILVGADRVPRVVDLGISTFARAVRDTGAGTLRYMAPEQHQGAAGRITGRTDLYGLGLTLEGVLGAMVPKVVLPERLSGLIGSATAGEPELRPASASDVATELRGIAEAIERVADVEVSWAGPGRMDGMSRFERRVISGGLIVAAAMCSMVLTRTGGVMVDHAVRVSARTWAWQFGALPRLGVPDGLRGVTCIVLGPEDDVEGLAGKMGIGGVRKGDVSSYRPLTAAVLRKVGMGRPMGVAIDLVYRDLGEGDAELVDAMTSMPAPVVLGTDNWLLAQTPRRGGIGNVGGVGGGGGGGSVRRQGRGGEDAGEGAGASLAGSTTSSVDALGRVHASEATQGAMESRAAGGAGAVGEYAARARALPRGGVTLLSSAGGLMMVDLAVIIPGRLGFASLALLAAANTEETATREGASTPTAASAMQASAISMSADPPGLRFGSRRFYGSEAGMYRKMPDSPFGDDAQFVGAYVAIPSDAALKSATVNYTTVLGWTRDEAARWLNGRIVLIASSREEGPMPEVPIPYAGGRKVYGFYGQATAIDGLRNGDLPCPPGKIQLPFRLGGIAPQALVELVVAGLGAWSMVLLRRSWVRGVVLGGAVAICVAWPMLGYVVWGKLYSLPLMVLALLLGVGLAAGMRYLWARAFVKPVAVGVVS